MDTRSNPAAVVDKPSTSTGGPRRVTGRAVPYDAPTDLGNVVETIAPGAFRDSLALESRLPLLVGHDRTQDPVGVAIDWQERRDGLHGVWELDTSPRALEVGRLVERGLYSFLSIGFQFRERGTTWTTGADGREHVRITAARLLEVSLVSTPAYVEAAVTGIRSAPAQLADLGRRIGAPLLAAAVTGTATQVDTAAGLVVQHVRALGAGAVAELEALASAVTDPALRINLARAASALTDAEPGQLSRVYFDQVRGDLGMTTRSTRPGPPPRRRPHRR